MNPAAANTAPAAPLNAVPPIIRPRGERWRLIAVLSLGSALLAGAAVLFWFNPANGGFYPRCALHALTGLHCPGCGGMRATHQLLHGNIAEAFRLNPLWVIVAPFVTWLMLREAARAFADRALPPKRVAIWWIWVLAVAMMIFGVLRNLPAFHWLAPG